MSIESGRYVRIEDNGQQNDSGGVGRTRIQDKIRQPSGFLAHGEQVSGWAFFFSYAPIFAHRCISILHLIKPPFDAPANLFQLFSGSRLEELLRLINGVKENAGKHMA